MQKILKLAVIMLGVSNVACVAGSSDRAQYQNNNRASRAVRVSHEVAINHL